MHLAATAIDSGFIDYALIVDGEGSRYTQLTTIERLQSEPATAVDVFDEFASLTLGSGAAAMVLGSLDQHPDAHRLVGGVARAGTEHHTLCVGDLDKMTTDTQALCSRPVSSSARTRGTTPKAEFDWAKGMDRYVIHQVSSVHTRLHVRAARHRPGEGAADLSERTATSVRPRSRSRWPASHPS